MLLVLPPAWPRKMPPHSLAFSQSLSLSLAAEICAMLAAWRMSEFLYPVLCDHFRCRSEPGRTARNPTEGNMRTCVLGRGIRFDLLPGRYIVQTTVGAKVMLDYASERGMFKSDSCVVELKESLSHTLCLRESSLIHQPGSGFIALT